MSSSIFHALYAYKCQYITIFVTIPHGFENMDHYPTAPPSNPKATTRASKAPIGKATKAQTLSDFACATKRVDLCGLYGNRHYPMHSQHNGCLSPWTIPTSICSYNHRIVAIMARQSGSFTSSKVEGTERTPHCYRGHWTAPAHW